LNVCSIKITITAFIRIAIVQKLLTFSDPAVNGMSSRTESVRLRLRVPQPTEAPPSPVRNPNPNPIHIRSMEAEQQKAGWIKSEQRKLQSAKEKTEAEWKPPPKPARRARRSKSPSPWDSRGRILPGPAPPEAPPELPGPPGHPFADPKSEVLLKETVRESIEVRNLHPRPPPPSPPRRPLSNPADFADFIDRQALSIEKRSDFIRRKSRPPQRRRAMDPHSAELAALRLGAPKPIPEPEPEPADEPEQAGEGEKGRVPRWLTEVGRATLRQLQIELIRLERDAQKWAAETHQPEFASDPAMRESAGERRKEILAEKRKKAEQLREEEGQKVPEKAPVFRAMKVPRRTQQLCGVLRKISGRAELTDSLTAEDPRSDFWGDESHGRGAKRTK
jgi:hypothetical protein